MKKFVLIFTIVFISILITSVIVKYIQTPQFSDIKRPIIDNLRPWKIYHNKQLGITLSYPAYLTDKTINIDSANNVVVVLSYTNPKPKFIQKPHIRIETIPKTSSLQNWFRQTYPTTHYCKKSESACHGVTLAMPIVINGKTAFIFDNFQEKFYETIAVLESDNKFVLIINRNTPAGTIPKSTFEKVLKSVKL